MNNNRIDTRLYKGDTCFKYIPKHNYDTFKDQVQFTQGQLLQYLPNTLYQMNKNFETVKKLIGIGFWIIDIGFISYCHKIKIINKIFNNRWSMFGFKLACVIGPFFGYLWVQKTAINQNLTKIYSLIQDDYRKYKNTGDILLFNQNVKIFDIQWPNLGNLQSMQGSERLQNSQIKDRENNQNSQTRFQTEKVLLIRNNQ